MSSVYDLVNASVQPITVDVLRPLHEVQGEMNYLINHGYICTGQMGGGDIGSCMVYEISSDETMLKAKKHAEFCERYMEERGKRWIDV